MNKSLINRPESQAQIPGTLLPDRAPELHLLDQSDNTRQAYQRALKQFVLGGGHLPTSPQQIILYLETHLHRYSLSSLRQLIAALSDWHQRHKFLDPVTDDVRRALRAAGRQRRHQPLRKAEPLTFTLIKQLVDATRQDASTPAALRDSCLILMGYAAALRRSELAALRHQDLRFDQQRLILHLPFSKTDQQGHGRVVAVPRIESQYCPVAACEAWLANSMENTGGQQPLFYALRHSHQAKGNPDLINGLPPLSVSSVNRILKKRAREAGIEDISHISGHSLRRGFATDAVNRGVPLTDVAQAGRWQKLDTLKEYVQPQTQSAIRQLFDD